MLGSRIVPTNLELVNKHGLLLPLVHERLLLTLVHVYVTHLDGHIVLDHVQHFGCVHWFVYVIIQ